MLCTAINNARSGPMYRLPTSAAVNYTERISIQYRTAYIIRPGVCHAWAHSVKYTILL